MDSLSGKGTFKWKPKYKKVLTMFLKGEQVPEVGGKHSKQRKKYCVKNPSVILLEYTKKREIIRGQDTNDFINHGKNFEF